MKISQSLSVLIGALAVCLQVGHAAPITGGNILISSEEVLYEYTPAGVFVQSFPIPYATGPYPVTEYARDIAMRIGDTTVHVHNGTFDPYLSTLDSSTSLWSHQTFAGWSTAGNISYGGIAVGGSYAYVADMATAFDGAPQGIVRFDFVGGMDRFATAIDPIDLNVGHDALLYALDGDRVYVYKQTTMALQKVVNLDIMVGPNDYRAVAANASGQMFVVNWGGILHKTDPDGNSLLSVNLFVSGHATTTSLIDVDVSASGTVVVGDDSGDVVVTDENLSSFTTFTVGSSPVFVAVQTGIPVPVSLSTFSLD